MKSFNRREFITAVGGATAATMLFGRKGFSADEKIKIGFMGIGGRGVVLAGKFAQRPDIEITWLCDVDKRRFGPAREAIAGRDGGGVRPHSSWWNTPANSGSTTSRR